MLYKKNERYGHEIKPKTSPKAKKIGLTLNEQRWSEPIPLASDYSSIFSRYTRKAIFASLVKKTAAFGIGYFCLAILSADSIRSALISQTLKTQSAGTSTNSMNPHHNSHT